MTQVLQFTIFVWWAPQVGPLAMSLKGWSTLNDTGGPQLLLKDCSRLPLEDLTSVAQWISTFFVREGNINFGLGCSLPAEAAFPDATPASKDDQYWDSMWQLSKTASHAQRFQYASLRLTSKLREGLCKFNQVFRWGPGSFHVCLGEGIALNQHMMTESCMPDHERVMQGFAPVLCQLSNFQPQRRKEAC